MVQATWRPSRAQRNATIRAAAATTPVSALAREYGLTPSGIRRILGRTDRQLTRRERFMYETVTGMWRAACMSDDEWTEWVALNPLALSDPSVADRPCVDCPLGFAADMRAAGRCNGAPGAVVEDDDDDPSQMAL